MGKLAKGYDNTSIRSDGGCVSTVLLTVVQVWDQRPRQGVMPAVGTLIQAHAIASELHTETKVIWPDQYQSQLIYHLFSLLSVWRDAEGSLEQWVMEALHHNRSKTQHKCKRS